MDIDKMCALQKLHTLCLSCCKLEAVPLELANMTALRTINLSNNYIYDLPGSLHTLSHLASLDLRRNRLHFLPTVLTQLTSLRALDLAHNKLQYDRTAVRVAALPLLESFKFPSASETFVWAPQHVRPSYSSFYPLEYSYLAAM
jgi:Leucine-rich repeat (LRR) protein